MTRAALRRLRKDRRGVTLVEFGIVSPVLMLFLVGAFDIAHALYLQIALQGAVQKSARDSTLEAGATSSAQAAIDTRVRESLDGLTFGQPVTFQRRFYRTFSKAASAQAEVFTDSVPGNGRCDNGEQYQDSNNNNVWDADGGDSGQGLAFDRAVYTATVTYPRLFPLWKFIGGSSTNTIQARTVLMNQPYTGQQTYAAPTARNCA